MGRRAALALCVSAALGVAGSAAAAHAVDLTPPALRRLTETTAPTAAPTAERTTAPTAAPTAERTTATATAPTAERTSATTRVAPTTAATTRVAPTTVAPTSVATTVAPVSGAQARAEGSEEPVPVGISTAVRAGRRLSSAQVLAIADRVRSLRRVRAAHRGSYGAVYLAGPGRWQVSYISAKGTEIAQAIVDDRSGRVEEAWTGFQVAWRMARGYPGAFGRHVDALWVWLPLCLLFVVPFAGWRRPLSLRNLDLLALLAPSISLAFFNHGRIYQSVPLAYPPLLYLLGRALHIARPLRRDRPARGRPVRLAVPRPWLTIGVLFLVAFRIALNVSDSNVIDVGYSGVIGAQRIVDGRPLYGSFPREDEHGDTYGPVNYEAYVPFVAALGFSGHWDSLPAAHGAAIAFDLLAMALLYLLGRRVRGPTLGIALVYAWAAYPFTLFAMESNSNDTLVAALLVATLLAAARPAARGAFAALAGLTKLAPFALAPLLATHRLRELPPRGRRRSVALFLAALALTAVVASIPALAHNSIAEIWRRTVTYQANRESPFSVWGLYGWHAARTAAEALAAALAIGLALVRRRDDVIGLAAACAAVLIAVQLAMEHWFYLYIPWFFPLVLVALVGDAWAQPASERVAVSRSASGAIPRARSLGVAGGPGRGDRRPAL